jgi:ethanolamine permease
MAVFGAVLAYVLQMVSFIALRMRFRHMERPYRSPVGIAGAVVAALVALVTLIVLFQNPAYNKGVIGASIWFVFGIAYYVFYARHRLVLAPEELAAFAHRREESPEA